jgi:uncharacterized protein (DUF1800 family)
MRHRYIVFLLLSSISQLVTQGATEPVKVTLNTASLTVRTGQEHTFEASVTNAANKAVIWRVNQIAGGNSVVGLIDASGHYTAPAHLPSPAAVTIDAVSAADPSKLAAAAVTLLNAAPVITSISPSEVNVGLPFTVTIIGTDFVQSPKVTFDDNTSVTIASQSATEIVVKGRSNSAAGTIIHVTATNPSSGGTASNAKTVNVAGPVAVTVSPKTKTMRGLAVVKFSASVSNTPTKTVSWSVNGITGGNSAVGTIAPDGTFTAPAIIPASVTIRAASTVDTTKSDSAQVTLQNPIPTVTAATSPLTAGTNATITITGSGFATGAQVLLGNIPLTIKQASASQLIATGLIQAPAGGISALIVQNPNPGAAVSNTFPVTVRNSGNALTAAAAWRFLQHASWGPTPTSVAHLQAIGINAWLAEQFSTAPSAYNLPVDTTSNLSTLQEQFFSNAVTGNDQLRQRVAFALGQIAVVSGLKLTTYDEMMPYQQMLLNDAFGSYHTFLTDVTLSPAMGHYLDMVNNNIPSATQSADENYAREVMQLFSLGLAELNADGSSTTNPATPPYGENDVRALARVFTGWTYPACFAASKWTNPACFQSPMVAIEAHHDDTAKSFLGVNIQTGSAAGDLDMALRTIESFQSPQSGVPNIAPFVALRLIQHLVTSNPDPAYVSRVAKVFAQSNGDLKQTVTAILTDSAAGDNGATLAANQGHLSEPVLYTAGLLRALNANVVYSPPLSSFTTSMGQDLFFSPSVFNYYSPFYHLPETPTVAPEFQILSQATSFSRANFAYRAAWNQINTDVQIDLSNFVELAADTNAPTQTASMTTLLNAVSQALLGQPMTTEMLNAIMPAMLATTDANTRARNAVFLVAASPQYQVQR